MLFERDFSNPQKIKDFITFVLGEDVSDELCKDICSCEIELEDMFTNNTFVCDKYRQDGVKTGDERKEIRAKIIKELFELVQLDNDDDIKLGNGGARPIELKSERKAIVVIGSTAAGKSTVASELSKKIGAFILDVDFAKRKIPEYALYGAGSTVVHDESYDMIFGQNSETISLFGRCIKDGYNLIIPQIGKNSEKTAEMSKLLNKLGYEVHLILVSLDRKKTTSRALKRYNDTKRYVPLSLIYDSFNNEPILSFYRLKDNVKGKDHKFVSFGKLSTDGIEKERPLVILSQENSPVMFFG